MFGNFKEFAFGFTEDFERFRIFVVSSFSDTGSSGDEAAADSSFIDDFGISFSMGGGWNEAGELG